MVLARLQPESSVATKEEIAEALSVGISVNAGCVYSPEHFTHSISIRQLDIIYSGGRSCVIDPIYPARHGPP
jgi:hypothetical protein